MSVERRNIPPAPRPGDRRLRAEFLLALRDVAVRFGIDGAGAGLLAGVVGRDRVLRADEPPPPGRPTFYAEITGAAEESAGVNRWRYAWKEKIKTDEGHAGWADRPNGRTGTAISKSAYNLFESPNSAAAAGGVDISGASGYPAGFDPARVPDGSIVRMEVVTIHTAASGAKYEHWFMWAGTPHDGTCGE